MDENKKDIDLLMNDPGALLVKYQNIVEISVVKYCGQGYFPYADVDEVCQYVNEKILIRAENLQKQYNGSSLVRTYLAAVIRNAVLEYVRHHKRSGFSAYEGLDVNKVDSNFSIDKVILREEFERLERILSLFTKKRAKTEICLKMIHRIPITIFDLKKYSDKIDSEKSYRMIRTLNESMVYKEKDILHIMNDWFSYHEDKTTTIDTMRKWVKGRIKEIIRHLNGFPPTRAYDEESLHILLEKYYEYETKRLKF